MKYSVIAIALILLMTTWNSCSSTKDSYNPETLTFSTTDPSKLYFNNVRSSYYGKSQYGQTDIDVYTHDDFITPEDSTPYFYNAIANNWMNDKAMLLPQTVNWEDTVDYVRLFFQHPNDSLSILECKEPTPQSRFSFSQDVYKILKQKGTLLTINQQGDLIPVLDTQQEKTAYRVTFRDYCKLIELD